MEIPSSKTFLFRNSIIQNFLLQTSHRPTFSLLAISLPKLSFFGISKKGNSIPILDPIIIYISHQNFLFGKPHYQICHMTCLCNPSPSPTLTYPLPRVLPNREPPGPIYRSPSIPYPFWTVGMRPGSPHPYHKFCLNG